MSQDMNDLEELLQAQPALENMMLISDKLQSDGPC